jgi:hypothetical protein
MVQLITKLDIVRMEQSAIRGNCDGSAQRKRLRGIELFLNNHQRTCLRCRKLYPDGSMQFGQN